MVLHCAGSICGFRTGHCRCGYDAEVGNTGFHGSEHSIFDAGALPGADQAARAEVGPSCGDAVYAGDRTGVGISIRRIGTVIWVGS